MKSAMITRQMCSIYFWKEEGNVLFNDALNKFYLRLYGVRHMVKTIQTAREETCCRHMGIFFSLPFLYYQSNFIPVFTVLMFYNPLSNMPSFPSRCSPSFPVFYFLWFYLSLSFSLSSYGNIGRKEGNVLFNDALNTFTIIWRQTCGKGPFR